ncbi:MAG: TonB-dependent receptor, partial [Bacteroidetes bacterium]
MDGKPFFGQDPTIATRNLPADAVDKVQVFDEQSEAARFTGIDDGQRTRTINLALKEDKKQGRFGQATAGYGTEDRYAFRGNLNQFNDRRQLSALGALNNTNQPGFSLQEYMDFMGGLQMLG